MKLKWAVNDDGESVANVDHEDDTIEVKIVDYAYGDRVELSCGSLEVALDAPTGRDEPKRFAALMVKPFIALMRSVNTAARKVTP